MFFEVQKILGDAFHKKYRNIVFKKKYYLQRYKFQKKIIEVRKKNKTFKKHSCASCKYFKDKNKWKNNNLVRFYKKFNVHLKLKEKYDLKLMAKSNREACLQSYLIFITKIYNCKKFNDVQKLNTILKVNDLILIKYSEFYTNLDLKYLNNFSLERKLIKKLIS